MRASEAFAFIGRKACGCVVSMVVESAADDAAAQIAVEWSAEGLTVERLPVAVVRDLAFGCTHTKRLGLAL